MKRVKMLLTAAFSVVGMAAFAQLDFSQPQFAKWGDTPEEREENFMNSTFLSESIKNKQYNEASGYFNALVEKRPEASVNTFKYGVQLFKNKISRAKSMQEKNGYIDSLLWVYDLRIQYFGDTEGHDVLLGNKAREILTYRPAEREIIRAAFVEAIDAGAARNGKADPAVIAIYFKELCDDYKNDEVDTTDVLDAYEKLSPMFVDIDPKFEEHRTTFETCFGLSGAASCENLEKLFTAKLAAAPNDPVVLGQAVSLMSRANCDSDFFFNPPMRYYDVQPSSETALFLAQGFQNRGEYDTANTYLREALKTENDPEERVKLLVRIATVELAGKHYSNSASAASEAIAIDPENGLAYFIMAQAITNGSGGCDNELKGAIYWVAYDIMAQAVARLDNDPNTKSTAQESMARYRAAWPSKEDGFFFFGNSEEGGSYTVKCGLASGRSTTVRYSR